MFSLIPKTDTGLWLGPIEFSPPVALLSIPGRLVRPDVFLFVCFLKSSSSWQYGSHVNYYYALERVKIVDP